MILAIDPGSERSAWVLYDGARVNDHGIDDNGELVAWLHERVRGCYDVVIEKIASYGMPVGAEVFDTCMWIGRFWEAAGPLVSVHLLYRRDVKLHMCGQARAKDANVRQALLDRFGGEKAAKGTKASPGPLHGLKKDEWQAAALAVTWMDLHGKLETK